MNTQCRQVYILGLLMINCAGLSRCMTKITRERLTSARWRASWWSVDSKIVDKLSLWLSVNNVVTCIGDGQSQILHWANALFIFTSHFYHVSLLTACIVPSFLTRFIAQSPAQSKIAWWRHSSGRGPASVALFILSSHRQWRIVIDQCPVHCASSACSA